LAFNLAAFEPALSSVRATTLKSPRP